MTAGLPPSLPSRAADALVGLGLAVFETVGFWVLWRLSLPWLLPLLAVHAATIAMAWGWHVRRARRQDATAAQLMLLAIAATGPIGACLAALAALVPPRAARDDVLLDDWYERIALASDVDEVTQLADGIVIGRTIDLSRPAGGRFSDVMRGTDIKSQQAVLGLIARAFKPDYVPALGLALKSREPIIRVQAAAVATRVRPGLAATIEAARGLLAPEMSSRGAERITARRHLELALESGLLDVADQHVARDVLSALAAEANPAEAMQAGPGATTASAGRLSRLPPLVRREIEARLIAGRRFAEFRRMRRIVRIGAGRLYRMRAMPRRRMRAEPMTGGTAA